ncbi:MAG: putative nucleic acid-binding protein [Verrucomicrobiales bacterium]|jgi:predicted nucleic acid-binding protein
MAAKTFIDTNVLIYSVDSADAQKRERALQLIAALARDRTGVISTQILQEFYSAATRKLGIEPLNAKPHIRDFQIFDIVQVTPVMIDEGIDWSILNQISFWDGLVVAAAETAGCHEMFSEDLGGGQTIRGVTIRNPFR